MCLRARILKISLESFNLAWKPQSRLTCSVLTSEFRTNKGFGGWLAWNFQSRMKSAIPLQERRKLFWTFGPVSENSRRQWLFLGSAWGFPRKIPGKSRENYGKSLNRKMLWILGTGTGERKPATNLGSTLSGSGLNFPWGVFLRSTVTAFSSFSDLGVTIRDENITYYILKDITLQKKVVLLIPTQRREKNCNCNQNIHGKEVQHQCLHYINESPQKCHAVKFPVLITENILPRNKKRYVSILSPMSEEF